MKYDVVPVPKPRQSRSDRWKQRPAVMRYREFCDQVREAGITLYSCGMHITFIIPMPDSWSEKKKLEMDGQPHQQRGDLDNYAKSALDAIYEEDAHVWDMRLTKLWGREGAIIVEKCS